MAAQFSNLTANDLPELQLETTRTQRDINWIIKYLRKLAPGTGNGGGHIIADEGAPLPAQPTMDFVGGGVQVIDYPGTNTTRVLIDAVTLAPSADIAILDTTVQRAGNRVLLFSGGGELLEEYGAIPEALAAATAGDVVQVPAGTWAGNLNIPAGVTVAGIGWASIINGYVMLHPGSALRTCKVYQSVNSASDIIGVMGPYAAGSAYVIDVFVELIQAGSGKALGTLARGGAGAILEWQGNYRIRCSGGTGSRWAYEGTDGSAVIMNHGNVKAWIGA